jgi:TolB-like protein
MLGALAELKRRRVFRVAGIYAVVSWVTAEVASVIFPALQLPEWTVTFVIGLLLLGFPLAMVLAWVFDIGPGGIERTAPAEEAPTRSWHHAVYLVLLAVAMGALAWVLYPRFIGPSQASRDSIAVLPFEDLSQARDQEYFSDGISEELLNLLAQVPDLQVASRTSSFSYRGQNMDIRDVGRQLGVDTVLEGTVRKAGEQVRITAQLIDSSTGYHLWSNTYDRELKDIFSVQDEIAREIVAALKVELGTGAEPVIAARAAPPTSDMDAWQTYLQARHQWKRRGEESIARSIDLLKEATASDPQFARAWAGLAAAYVVYPGYAGADPEEWNERASEAARRALSVDPNIGEAHAVLAEIDNMDRRWSDAEAGFFFATNLDPTDPTARHWYSILLRTTGRLQDSLEQGQLALELDPTSPVLHFNVAETYMALGYDDQAARHIRSARELGFHEGSSGIEYVLALRKGDLDGMTAFIADNLEKAGADPALAEVFMAAATDDAALAELETTVDQAGDALGGPGSLMPLLILSGRTDEALVLMDELTEDGRRDLDLGLIWTPEAADIRRDPRFGVIMGRLGLTDYWKQYGPPDDCRLDDGELHCGFLAVAGR